MKAAQWKTRIKKACVAVGTYDPAFDQPIKALSEILEQRDLTMEAYNGEPVVEHTNSHGNTNMSKNPALQLWNDLNATALAYWRELGLTPSAFRKATGGTPGKEEKGSALVEALKALS